MKNKISIPLLILSGFFILVLFSGCPYSSSVPLAPPSDIIEGSLYGKWVMDSSDENPSYYSIEEMDGLTFILNKYSWNADSGSYTLDNRYTSWFTRIGPVLFMNIEDVEDPGTYYFHKLEMIGSDTFILYEVTDNIDEVFTDSREMYDFFDKYKDLSFFYNSNEETYHRES